MGSRIDLAKAAVGVQLQMHHPGGQTPQVVGQSICTKILCIRIPIKLPRDLIEQIVVKIVTTA